MDLNVKNNFKVISYGIIIIIMTIVLLEGFLHVLYYGTRGVFIWNSLERFNIIDFTVKVDDERYVTMKKNYKYRDKTNPRYTVETDEFGFRNGKNIVSKEGENLVFIGDSVPFGWGVAPGDSVPSKVYDLLAARGVTLGVINAAIPSYSLDQAVHRYAYEVDKKFKVQNIILQIYDPASQFAIFGGQWDVTQNWATFNKAQLVTENISWLKYSAYYYLYKIFFKDIKEKFDPNDHAAIAKYVKGIDNSLDFLRLNAHGVQNILILPVNIPKDAMSSTSKKRLIAIKILNDTMHNYAKSHAAGEPKIIFVSLNDAFQNQPPRQAFIDQCCHLTAYGAELEAKAVIDHLPGLQGK
jgi:hypothetical protein